MSQKLFVGGLAYATTESELQSLFETKGTVVSTVIVNDRDTGRSKGFGFVVMEDDNEAKAAIDGLNGTTHKERDIVVNEARPRKKEY